jgi:ClpP class serine protease
MAAGLKLTAAVEQVAASKGYMMCCVADRSVASAFAVLGPLSDIPNVYERLKKEGIEFQTGVTAGKYKRTLTPTKKVTPEDFIKSTADVETSLSSFVILWARIVPSSIWKRLRRENPGLGGFHGWYALPLLKSRLCLVTT